MHWFQNTVNLGRSSSFFFSDIQSITLTNSPIYIWYIIGNYSRSHLLRAPWLAEKQPITGCYQHICRTATRARVLQTNILFAFWHQLCNTESWLLTKRATACGALHTKTVIPWETMHVGTRNSPSSSLWICTDQPTKRHETERTVTKTNAVVESAENTSFCKSSSFLYLFH